MGVAPTVAMELMAEGSISNLAFSIPNYLCINSVLLSKGARSISLSDFVVILLVTNILLAVLLVVLLVIKILLVVLLVA